MPERPYQPMEGDASEAVQPCFERWEYIKPFVVGKGTVLDVGCNTGWFCRKFASVGWLAIGIDRNEDWLQAAIDQNPKLTTDLQWPEYVRGDVLMMNLPEADIALCLSVAMYLFDDPAKGWTFFDNLSRRVPIMFMDFGGMYAHRLPFTEETVIGEMKARTAYRSGRLLGRTNFEHRPFFLFTT